MSVSQAFLERFRCAEKFAQFEYARNGHSAPAFFRFGPDAICYGKVGIGFASDDVAAELHDSSADVRVERDACFLPFDPDEVVENLRRERHAADAARGPQRGGIRKVYYAVRPLLPVPVRKHLQRIALRGWNERSFPSWPVDRSADKILERLMSLALRASGAERIPFIWFWPEGKSAAAIMTHDVETRAGLDFCPTLMDLNDSYEIKSSFQLIPGGRYVVSQSELDAIRGRGFEINVHDWNHDGNLYSHREEFLKRASKINQAAERFGAQGFRAGVMYRNLDWYDAYQFSYDMSVPNVAHLDPQTGGCCTVMPYFVGRVVELPLTTTQDYPLFNIIRDYSTALWKRQIDLILSGNGLISSIVHPDYVIEKRARAVYGELLAMLSSLRRDRNVWVTLPGEVNRWWRERSQMKLVESRGPLEIEGPAADRARVAYASLVGDRLVYTLA